MAAQLAPSEQSYQYHCCGKLAVWPKVLNLEYLSAFRCVLNWLLVGLPPLKISQSAGLNATTYSETHSEIHAEAFGTTGTNRR